MEGCVVHDDETRLVQFGQQALLDPGTHSVMGAVALKQHRREPFLATLRHDEISALAVVAMDFTMHFLAAFCPAVGTMAVVRKAALIKVHHVAAAVLLHPVAQGL